MELVDQELVGFQVLEQLVLEPHINLELDIYLEQDINQQLELDINQHLLMEQGINKEQDYL